MFLTKNYKKGLILTVLAVLSLSLLLFTGCFDDGSDNDAAGITGYWVSDYGDGFEIDDTVYPHEFYYYKTAALDYAFWGYIVNKVDYAVAENYLTILIKGNDGITAGSPDYGNDDMEVDSFTVARIKNFTGTTCLEASSPYKFGEARIKATQSEAESTFTDGNSFFDYPAEYHR